MTDVTVEGVSVRYDTKAAIDNLSLAVGSGEIVAVVGPSGSGKSTLLRAIAGLQTLDSGRVLIGSRDVSAVPTHKRDLGLMFQDHALFAHLNVQANVEYGLKFGPRDLSRQQRTDRANKLLELVGLDSYQGRRVDSLSGGEAQRVALARALAPEPGLLMLDEPLGSLDRTLRVQLIEDLARLLREVGQTALYVTHDQTEAFALADRIAIMNHGRLLAVGQPGELWADPGLEFVAEFLGHRNIWTVDKDQAGDIWWRGTSLGAAHGSVLAAQTGPVRVVAPVPALSIAPAGSAQIDGQAEPMSAVVDKVEFDQGVYRLSATLLDSATAAASALGEQKIYVDSHYPVAASSLVVVTLDVTQLSALDSTDGDQVV